jgi:hypothetical protein
MFKMKQFTLLTVVTVFFLMGINSCKTKDGPSPESKQPSMSSIQVSGGLKHYEVLLGFSEGVYKNSDKTGDLDKNSFEVGIDGGSTISSYLVNHSAGQSNAKIIIELNDNSTGNETLEVRPNNSNSIFNADGTAMAASEKKTASLDGTVHETIVIKDDGNGTGTTTWTANNLYILDGLVFINNGQTLTIEAGTIIKGKAGQGANASALIVSRGGKIMAEGTAKKPIIFTAEADDLNGSVQDLTDGLWGGVIVLGKAELNTIPREQQIEGISQTEPRGVYGGTDNTDNSGILKYISIRHGGTDIGEGNEINGLTLGAVGSKTVIEYIEVFANKDDGIEFFGGMPRLKHIVTAFCGDDSFDYDQGFRGFGQFWLGVQGYERGDRLGEHDGGTDPETGEPYAIPTIFNATYIGRGEGAAKRTLTFRDNAGGNYANSIFYNQEKGIDIELLVDECSYTRYEAGQLTIKNNIFFNIGDPVIKVSTGSGVTDADKEVADQILTEYLNNSGNEVSDPGFIINGNTFKVIPTNSVSQNLAATTDEWFNTVNYKGAIDPSDNWLENWTLFSKYMK